MRELRSLGSVRGVRRKGHSYRDDWNSGCTYSGYFNMMQYVSDAYINEITGGGFGAMATTIPDEVLGDGLHRTSIKSCRA